jgi:hypothetical protein
MIKLRSQSLLNSIRRHVIVSRVCKSTVVSQLELDSIISRRVEVEMEGVDLSLDVGRTGSLCVSLSLTHLR